MPNGRETGTRIARMLARMIAPRCLQGGADGWGATLLRAGIQLLLPAIHRVLAVAIDRGASRGRARRLQ